MLHCIMPRMMHEIKNHVCCDCALVRTQNRTPADWPLQGVQPIGSQSRTEGIGEVECTCLGTSYRQQRQLRRGGQMG